MTRADEARALADHVEKWGDLPMSTSVRFESATALRDYAELLDALEELLRLGDASCAPDPAWDAAWERLRRAVGP